MRNLVWVLVGVVSFSAAGVMWARADTAERFVPPGVSSTRSAAPAGPDVGEDVVERVLANARTLPSQVGEVRAECLRKQGRPEMKKALGLRRPATGVQRHEPLRLALLDFGPTTREEAQRWGLVGTELAFDEGDVGILISRDRAFDLAGEQCDTWMYEQLAPGLKQDQSDLAAFVDTVEHDFVDRVSRAVTPILAERVRCVTRDYSALRVDQVLESDSMLEILAAAGVEAGTRVDPPEGPTKDDVRDGEVGVFEPLPAATYSPSPAEVTFATAYADCAAETDFVKRVAAEAASIREDVVARHTDEAAGLLARLETDTQRLAAVVVR